MRVLREALLSLFVVGIVLYLYFVAVGATLLSFFWFASNGGELEAAHHLKVAAT